MAEQSQQPNINIKVEDQILKGNYSNLAFVTHSKEEFILDFMSVWGPQGVQVAKIITSPAHFKRILGAFSENLKKYEKQFGSIEEGKNQAPAQSTSTDRPFGFGK